jgi:hypothetical protein
MTALPLYFAVILMLGFGIGYMLGKRDARSAQRFRDRSRALKGAATRKRKVQTINEDAP